MRLRSLLPLVLATGLLASVPSFVREGKGPGVLLVHGLGGNREVWAEVAKALAKDHTVVRVDLPGSSGSEGPAVVDGAAAFEPVATELAALVRREQLEPCLIVGHSMGGPLSALAVLRDPGAFRGLVLVDSFLGVVPAGFFEGAVKALEADPRGALQSFFKPMTSGEAQGARVLAEALQVPVPAIQAYLRGLTVDNLKGRQGSLKLPVAHFKAGAEDPDPARRKAALTFFGFQELPDFRTVAFPKARHWVMWDEPDAFLKALRAFEADLHLRLPKTSR
ncbi:MAG: alpha/beta hydrolase [Holophaga sp.]|nr:alpha/beta hydrolase [Holophaga sp.]